MFVIKNFDFIIIDFVVKKKMELNLSKKNGKIFYLFLVLLLLYCGLLIYLLIIF